MVAADTIITVFLIVVGIAGVSASYLAIRTFHIRQWKVGMYYFTASLVLYTVQKIVELVVDLERMLPLQVALEVGVVASIIYGVLRLRDTADMIGA